MNSLTDISLKNKIVLLRSSLNVPISSNEIQNDFKLLKSLPTIKYLIKNKCKIILCGHIGRPSEGKKHSTKLLKKRLELLLKRKILFNDNFNFKQINSKINQMKFGDILLLENLRFNKKEVDNDLSFSRSLANLADICVQDSYETIHRNNASIVGVCNYIPAVFGFLLEEELNHIYSVLKRAKKPFTFILGGGKSDKLNIIKHNQFDFVLIGGANANKLIDSNKRVASNIVLPEDFVYDKDNSRRDIGPKSISKFKAVLKKSKTIIWCGPLGMFENKKFESGTKEIVKFLNKLNANIVIGGGESSNAALKYKLKNGHISTGGGATIELLKKKEPCGLKAIKKSQKKFKSIL